MAIWDWTRVFFAMASRTTGIGPEWVRTSVASPGFELMVVTRLCSGAQPYHRTVPDKDIIAGRGQGQSGLSRILTQGGDKAVL